MYCTTLQTLYIELTSYYHVPSTVPITICLVPITIANELPLASTVSITNRRVPTTFANYLPLLVLQHSSLPRMSFVSIYGIWYFVFGHLHVALYRLLPIPSCNQPT